MPSAPTKLYAGLSLSLSLSLPLYFLLLLLLIDVFVKFADDVSLLVVLLDTNPFFWSTSSLPFSKFLSHVLSLSLLNPNSLSLSLSKIILIGLLLQVLSFLNSILLLNQINQIVVIATGCNSCDYIYDSSLSTNPGIENGKLPALCSELLKKLEDFVTRDEQLNKQQSQSLPPTTTSSLLSGSLSMALCCILILIMMQLLSILCV